MILPLRLVLPQVTETVALLHSHYPLLTVYPAVSPLDLETKFNSFLSLAAEQQERAMTMPASPVMFTGLLLAIMLPLATSFVSSSQKQEKPIKRQFYPKPMQLSSRQPYTQVISDVDDTIKSSGGVKIGDVALGGIDTQYERGEFYPGVFEFMLQLSLHSLPSADIMPAKVAILTARAEEFKLALELKDDSKLGQALRKTGEQSVNLSSWGLGPVLYGSVAEWVMQDRKGLRKFANFERLLEQDPTGTIMQYVYVGDTGELDQEAGETILREYPEVVKAVFLHVVSEEPYPPVPPPKLINGRPLVFFRTYIGAAAKATQLNLLSYSWLLKVCKAAKKSLFNVPRDDSKWVELDRDLNLAYRTMGLDVKQVDSLI